VPPQKPKAEKKVSTTAFGSLVFLFLSMLTLLFSGFLGSVLLATGAVVVGLAATTLAVLSLRED